MGFIIWGYAMKTTVEINDALLDAAKQYARDHHKTLRQVIEMTLQRFLKSQQEQPQDAFKLRKHSFRGEGLQGERGIDDWRSIREAIYSGRGE